MSGTDMRKLMESLNTSNKKLNEDSREDEFKDRWYQLSPKARTAILKHNRENWFEATRGSFLDTEDSPSGMMGALAYWYNTIIQGIENWGVPGEPKKVPDLSDHIDSWMDIQLEGRGGVEDVIGLITEILSYLPEDQMNHILSKYVELDDDGDIYSSDLGATINSWIDIQLEGSMRNVTALIKEALSYLTEEQVDQLLTKYNVVYEDGE